MNKQQHIGAWLRLDDIKVVETADPKEMLGKFAFENVCRHWFEDFIDDTGEVVSLERSEMIVRKGTKLTKDDIQAISFHLQAGDLTTVKVTDMDIKGERFILGTPLTCEVVISTSKGKDLYLVRAQSLENAIRIATEYATIYNGLENFYTVPKAEFKRYIVVEADDECMDADTEEIKGDIRYFHVTARTHFYSKFEDTNYEIILPSGDVGQAKARGTRFVEDYFVEDLQKRQDNSVRIIKAVPYMVTEVVPEDYCRLFKIDKKD